MNWSSVAGPKELMKNIYLSEPLWFPCSAGFARRLNSFALEVLFALSCEESSPVASHLCTMTTLKPCHWFILLEIKVTFVFIVQSHSFLAPTVRAARGFLLLHCRCVTGVRSIYQYSFL